jgi:hypothetical protein
MIGMAGAGLLVLAASILVIPAALLAIPLSVTMGTDSRLGDSALGAAYSGIVGIAALPAAVVGSVGYFLARAGQYALSDTESMKYKDILWQLIRLLDGNPMEVGDFVFC